MKRANIKAFFTVPFLSLISRFVTHFSTLLYGGFIRYTGLLQAASNLKPMCYLGIFGDLRVQRQCDSATVRQYINNSFTILNTDFQYNPLAYYKILYRKSHIHHYLFSLLVL